MFDNFFIASAKVKKKIYNANGKVVKRIYDKPKTPYQRLIESSYLLKSEKETLIEMEGKLNMVELKGEMEKCLEELFELSKERKQKSKIIRRQIFLFNKTPEINFQRHPVLI